MNIKQINWEEKINGRGDAQHFGTVGPYQISKIIPDYNHDTLESTGKWWRDMDSIRSSFINRNNKIEKETCGLHKTVKLAKAKAQKVFESFIQECIE